MMKMMILWDLYEEMRTQLSYVVLVSCSFGGGQSKLLRWSAMPETADKIMSSGW